MTVHAGGPRKTVVVSNRYSGALPQGSRTRPAGGLVSAVEPVLAATHGTWVAWGGTTVGPGAPVPGEETAGPYSFLAVPLSEDEYRDYYLGLANECLWPISHCLVETSRFAAGQWETYRRVNGKFARAAALAGKGGAFFWVHDYHLALVPHMLRRSSPQARIAFFWHIPFPPPDVFRLVPWQAELLTGMLGANLVGFHTAGYAKNFLESVAATLDVTVDFNRGRVEHDERVVQVRALPVGIDWERFSRLAASARVRTRAAAIRQALGVERLLLAVDRLDYTKGILERLAAFDLYLEQNPDLQGRITLLQIGIPSREGIGAYRNLRAAVEAAVGRVNGKYDRGYRALPVRYVSHPLDTEQLVAHYLAADVALVTPVRDGLNLVAKEFCACRGDESGVLVLSELAGAAEDMPGAVIVNPYDTPGVAKAIGRALAMPPAEQRGRMHSLRRAVQKHDVTWWWLNTLKYADTRANVPAAAAVPV